MDCEYVRLSPRTQSSSRGVDGVISDVISCLAG